MMFETPRRRIWKALKSRFSQDEKQSFSHDNGVKANPQAAIDTLEAELVAQNARFEVERKIHEETKGKLSEQLEECKSAYLKQCEIHKDTEARLKKQLEEYKSKYEELEKKTPFLEQLAKVGAAVRCRALEHSKGRRTFGVEKDKFTNLRGEVDIKVIEEGNIASHLGNIRADYSLYRLGYKSSEKDRELFSSIYTIRLNLGGIDILASRKATEAMDLQGTMAFCFAFTASTRSPGYDTRFTSLFRELRKIWTRSESARSFDSDPKVEEQLVLMRKIVDQVRTMERRQRNQHR
ncbi:hypothetical protein NHQ30_005604 [Ciborinia camelliae]|nr:hypothetical protein NHQ30_005604 [Ciborinia camelliae]